MKPLRAAHSRPVVHALTIGFLLVIPPYFAVAQAPTTLADFELPGSQPGDSGNLETPSKCDNCHGGYDIVAEAAFNWRGSMMSQAARDPLYFASVAIANQDAPDSGDLCLRCHTPAGWLEGRSVPTDGSALNNNDRQGVQCDSCHKLVNPVAASENPYPGDADYTNDTYPRDQAYLASLSKVPPTHGNGMYVVDSSNAKRGPFVDANAKHKMFYSPFHRESAICGTCHDVSNPVFEYNETAGEYLPNEFNKPAGPQFDKLFPIERTYSEWFMSAYNTPEGVDAPQYGGNVSTCQDCHMPDVTGYGCNKNGVPERTDLPLHDMTGGNTTIPALVAQLYPNETDALALEMGVLRARAMLQKAATMTLSAAFNGEGTLDVHVRVTNETGHKLPSGYPEGRRIWINLKAYNGAEELVFESGAYNSETAELNTTGAKIYEIKPGMSESIAAAVNRTAGPSFHFVLNNKIFSDNRIPPRGFTNTAFALIQSPVVAYDYDDGQYWDDTVFPNLPAETVHIEATLYYQTTSKEFVEFLRDENRTNNTGQVFYDLWANSGKSPPEVMARATWIPFGDLDQDGDVDDVDLNLLLSDYGEGNTYDAADLAALLANFGRTDIPIPQEDESDADEDATETGDTGQKANGKGHKGRGK